MQIEQLGPYRIGRKLGKGGMGSVYEAVHDKTGARVAVKALSPQLAMAEGFRERFEAEIESLKKLQHENIVRLMGYGEHEGIHFYSMELVDGPSLEQQLAGGQRFGWNETLLIAVQICRALKHAHDHGVVHRDIKPANLLVAADGRLKIADFGIARLFGGTQITTAGGVLGTADYMSPEQADGRAVTEKCDQYSLGCVMYALLAGRPPFRAKSMPEMLQLQRYAEPEPVRRYAPQTPEQLDRLIAQLLSKEPSQRFPNVLVLGRHMEAMQKALSRPTRQEAPAEKPRPQREEKLDATSEFNADLTLAPEDLSILPSETTDSGVYEGPTLADEAQLEVASTPLSVDGQSKSVATTGRTTATPATRTSRFTTVDEDARRRAEEQRSHWWAMGLQLLTLAASLGAIGWIGWRLTRPATADMVYAEINEHLDAEGSDDLRNVADEINDFLARFPDDPRAPEVRSYAEELELQREARRVRRGSGGGGSDHPILEVFNAALSVQASDPARAATLLEQLLALYPPTGQAASTLDESQRRYLTLAERELAKLRETLESRASEQLPLLQERLVAARRLESTEPRQAVAMYRALVELYDQTPWATSTVAQARERLRALDTAP